MTTTGKVEKTWTSLCPHKNCYIMRVLLTYLYVSAHPISCICSFLPASGWAERVCDYPGGGTRWKTQIGELEIPQYWDTDYGADLGIDFSTVPRPRRTTWKWPTRSWTWTKGSWKTCPGRRSFATYMRWGRFLQSLFHELEFNKFSLDLQCIQSCMIKLRVKRRSDSRLGNNLVDHPKRVAVR